MGFEKMMLAEHFITLDRFCFYGIYIEYLKLDC